jgi:hypothetical protein
MNETALSNIRILNRELSDSHQLIADGNKLSLIEKEDFSALDTLADLEYPIYFTYQHLLNSVTYDKNLSYLSRRYLLEQMEDSFDIVSDFLNDYDEDTRHFNELIESIELRHSDVSHQTLYKNKTCGKIVILFDKMVELMRNGAQYLYFDPDLLVDPLYHGDNSDSDETDSDSDVPSDDAEESGHEDKLD